MSKEVNVRNYAIDGLRAYAIFVDCCQSRCNIGVRWFEKCNVFAARNVYVSGYAIDYAFLYLLKKIFPFKYNDILLLPFFIL